MNEPREWFAMQVALVMFCVGVVWFYARFLFALFRDRPRRHVAPIRLRKDTRVSFAEKEAQTDFRRVA
jgi:hypothetical protein